MAKSTGRNAAFGIAKEGTRGTAESTADFWIPRLSFSLDDKTESINDESSLGVIEDVPNASNVKTWAEGEIEGNVRDRSIGAILMAAFGSVSTSADDPESGVNTHTFSVSQSAQHQSYTLFLKDHVQSYKHALGVLNSLSINAELGQYVRFNAGVMAQQGTSISDPTPSYLSENLFLPKNITLTLADTIGDMGSGTEVKVRSVGLSIEKNIEEDISLGDSTPQDYLTKMFAMEGEIELLFDAETFKTEQLANTQKALRLEIENTDVTIGSASNPKITIDLYKVHISDFTRNYANNDLISASIAIKPLYSTTDGKMAEVELINTQTSY